MSIHKRWCSGARMHPPPQHPGNEIYGLSAPTHIRGRNLIIMIINLLYEEIYSTKSQLF